MSPSDTQSDSNGATRRRFLRAIGAVGATTTAAAGSTAAQGPGATGSADDRADVEDAGDDAVVAALEERSIPLEARDGPVHVRDLVPTATRVADGSAVGRAARSDDPAASVVASALSEHPVVGLGEATHGTREFHVLRRRIVQRLVAEHGLRVVAFEDHFSSLVAVNDYVVHGEGSVEDALDAITFWVWSTEEVRRLLEWLRAFNEDRPRRDRVEVHGVDCQYPTYPGTALVEYLERADPETLERVEDVLVPVAESAHAEYFLDEAGDDLDEAAVAAVRETVATLDERLEEGREAHVAATSEREWRLATRHVRTLEQSADFMTAYFAPDESDFETRDRYMAENATWLLEELGTDQVVVWAHNDHVRRGHVPPFDDPAMGWFLGQTHGDDYHATALDFGRGAFTAVVDRVSGELGAPALEESEAAGSGLLAAVERPALYLDSEVAASDPRLAEWLEEPRELHSIGALYVPDVVSDTYDLAEEFDGVVFVEETTATTVLGRE